MIVGNRVKTKHDFLSSGIITAVVEDIGFVVRLDEKAPNEYAYNTHEVLLFDEDIELEVKEVK